MILGIDAHNIRGGGAVTYLVEILRVVDPVASGFDRVIIWSIAETLNKIEDRPWLQKIADPMLAQRVDTYVDRRQLNRFLWQRLRLRKNVEQEKCDLVFFPGGTNFSGVRPYVTINLNFLPFDLDEIRKSGISLRAIKLLLLRFMQIHTFQRADGIIFLNHYVKGKILPILDSLKGATAVIPFGVDVEFVNLVRPQKSIDCFSIEEPFRILYVSTVDTYKHQWHVARAVANLRLEGYPLELNLVGPAYARSLKRLTQTMKVLDPSSEFIRYFGHVPLRELHDLYKRADMKVFASSCEALPNILIEAMAAGLPIACSNRGPMPEVLGDAGVYFDPENVDEIGRAIRQLIDSPELRARNANMAFERAQQYSWQRCADETFSFFAKVVASARVEAV